MSTVRGQMDGQPSRKKNAVSLLHTSHQDVSNTGFKYILKSHQYPNERTYLQSGKAFSKYKTNPRSKKQGKDINIFDS